MGFKASLKAGNAGQQIVVSLLEKAGFHCESSKGKCVAYDLEVTGPLEFLAEVKYDLYAAKSGNAAIEYHNSKSSTDSGIMGTEAHLWFHVFNNPPAVWVTSVPRLLQYCMDVTPFKIITNGGDKNSDMFLYRKDVIQEIFVDLSQVEQGKVVGCLSECLQHALNSGDKG